MDEILEKLDKICETMVTLGSLFQEELSLVKAEQKQLKKEIDTLSYYIARIEGVRNAK